MMISRSIKSVGKIDNYKLLEEKYGVRFHDY